MRKQCVLACIGLLVCSAATAQAPKPDPADVAKCRTISDPSRQFVCFAALNAKLKRLTPPAMAAAPAPADPTGSPADRLKVAAGQPLCIDQDALATMLLSGILATKADDMIKDGCQSIPVGAQVDVLERYASGSEAMRLVKVRVTAPSLPGPTTGYTIELR
jgi:hypothetical protein